MLILPFIGLVAWGEEIPPNIFRPYAKFYEKGQEKSRFEKYLELKDSSESRKYSALFSEKGYKSMTIYQILYQGNYSSEIKIKKITAFDKFAENDRTMQDFIKFFSSVFPEKVRKPPAEESVGQILIFSGKKEKCGIFVPGVVGPEFNLIYVPEAKVSVGSTYKISDGAMSAIPPFDYFWKMCENKQHKVTDKK